MTAPTGDRAMGHASDVRLRGSWGPARTALRMVLARNGALAGAQAAIDAVVAAVQFAVVHPGDRIAAEQAGVIVVSGALKTVCWGGGTRGLVADFIEPGAFAPVAARPRTRGHAIAIIAHVPSLLATLDRDVVRRIVGTLPSEQAVQLATALWGDPASRIYERTALLDMPLRARVLHELRALAEKFGQPEEGGLLIDLPLRHHDVADLVGGTRPNVTRALRALAQDGVVQRVRARFVVYRLEG